MTAADVIARAEALGVALWVQNDELHYDGPSRASIAVLIDDLRAHAGAIIAFLREHQPCVTAAMAVECAAEIVRTARARAS